MDQKFLSFWLVVLSENSVNVGLVNLKDTINISFVDREIQWSDQSSLVEAIDQVIDVCSQQNGLDSTTEPEKTAFIISPFWVASDGRIIDTKLKLLQETCRQLKLTPMGFLPFDEAIVEESNQTVGIPESFVLAYVESNQLIVSVCYLGKIKKRLKKPFSGRFDPSLLESSLMEMNLESALPPLIKVSGQVDESVIQELKNYPWIGKKSFETFLHLPEIQPISKEKLHQLFAKIIARQVREQPDSPLVESDPLPLPAKDSTYDEVSPQDMGFTTPSPEPQPIPESIPEVEVVQQTPPQKPKISLPKLPKISIKLPKSLAPYYVGFVALMVIIFLLHLLSTATIDIFVTPISITKNIDTIISPNQGVASDKFKIISTRKSLDVEVSTAIPATGKKTVGQKAQGEIVLFNKSEKSIKVPKGTVLSSSNLKFEILNDTLVASSSSDLEKGIITLGQTKGQVTADTIGPEYNLAKDIPLEIKDDNQLIVKTAGALTGGSRQEISAVSQADRTAIEKELDSKISQSIDQKISSNVDTDASILKDTAIIKKTKIELNREIGEETEIVEGTVSATISYFSISPSTKDDVINQVLATAPEYQQIDPSSATYQFKFTPLTVTEAQAVGELSISASASPKVDQTLIKNKIKFTTSSSAARLIRQLIPRTYQYQVKLAGPSLFRLIDLLPINPQNIKIIIHSGQS